MSAESIHRVHVGAYYILVCFASVIIISAHLLDVGKDDGRAEHVIFASVAQVNKISRKIPYNRFFAPGMAAGRQNHLKQS